MGKKDKKNKGHNETVIYGVDKYGFTGVCYKKSREGVDASCTRHVVGHTDNYESAEKLASKYLESPAGAKFATGDFAKGDDFEDDPDDDIISVNEYGQASGDKFLGSGGPFSGASASLKDLSDEEVSEREAYSAFVEAKNRYGEKHPITKKLKKAMDNTDEDGGEGFFKWLRG